MSLIHSLCIGNKIIFLDECASTNNYAKNLLSKSEPIEGTVVSTANQTAGKGQFGNTWQSEPNKNLSLSIITYPKFVQAQQQFYISICTSLACISFLEQFSDKNFKIKWPNDIYRENKKIGGILIENQIQQRQISSSIIGIGININQQKFDNLPQATSLFLEEKDFFDRKECLVSILKELDKYYLLLRQGKYDKLLEMYYRNMLGYNEERLFLDKNEGQFLAKTIGISPIGELHLEKNGKTQLYSFKEVEWVF